MRAAVLLLFLVAGCRSAATGPGQAAPVPGFSVSFEGVTAFGRAELKALVRSEWEPGGGPPSRADVDDGAYALLQQYVRAGYVDAEVDYALEESGARFTVREGQRVVLAEARLLGVTKLNEEALRALLPRTGAPFVGARVEEARAQLLEAYATAGFLTAGVQTTVDRRADEVHVTWTVVEGARHRLVAVRLAEGSDGPFDQKKLEALVGADLGGTYTPQLAFELRARIVTWHAERGRPDATVEVLPLRGEDGRVELTFTLEPGPAVLVSGIRVEGAEGRSAKRVLGRITQKVGAPYDVRAIRESFRRLFTTGLYETVNLDLEGPGTERVLVARVTELPSLELRIEPGYGSYEGPRFSVGLTENDLFGTGRRLSLDTVASARAQRAEIEFVEPFLLGYDVSLGLTVFANRREEPSFTFVEKGAELALTRYWSRQVATTLGYRLRGTRLESFDVLTSEARGFLEDADIASLFVSLNRDTTRHPFEPREGNRSRLQIEWASTGLGSAEEFLGASMTHARFHSLGEHTVLALSARLDARTPYGQTAELPLQLRLFNGGENTVRSFREDELGPLDSKGAPLGGEAASVFSVELRQDLAGSLSGALFVDGGNVDLSARRLLRFEDFRTGLGAGLRYLLPIGHLRFDGAFLPGASGDENEFVLFVTVGMAF